MTSTNTNIQKFILLVAILTLSGCTYFKAESFGTAELGSVALDNAPGGNGDIVVIAGAKTASVQSAGRYLRGLESCTGIKASNQTRNAFRNNEGSLSVEGRANSITAPMLKGSATIAGEICSDLVRSERGIKQADRRIFGAVDFNQGPVNVSNQAVGDVVRRLARSCWGRNETNDELSLIQDAVNRNFMGSDKADTELKMVYVCASMLASLASLEM